MSMKIGAVLLDSENFTCMGFMSHATSSSLLSCAHFVVNDELVCDVHWLLLLRTTVLLVCFCNFHARSPSFVGNILVRVGPSIDHVDRALSVIDCEDRYYNFM